MKFAVIIVQRYKLISKLKKYIVAVPNSPDSIKKTIWLKSFSLSKSNNSQICQFTFKILIFSKRHILGLFLRLFEGPNSKFVVQTNIKTSSRSEIFYSGVPKDLVELRFKSQLPTPAPLLQKVDFCAPERVRRRAPQHRHAFFDNFWHFRKNPT